MALMSHNKGQRVLISGSIATYWTGPTTISVLVHVGEYLVAGQDDVVRLGLDEANKFNPLPAKESKLRDTFRGNLTLTTGRGARGGIGHEHCRCVVSLRTVLAKFAPVLLQDREGIVLLACTLG